jgi:hypothetical protein
VDALADRGPRCRTRNRCVAGPRPPSPLGIADQCRFRRISESLNEPPCSDKARAGYQSLLRMGNQELGIKN